jgi:hypothetical protein
MTQYFVNMNEQANGDHEVHRMGCDWLPRLENRIYLGEYDSCRPAVMAARLYYRTANGCYFCSNNCHTS